MSSRDRILERLRRRPPVAPPAAADFGVLADRDWSPAERLDRFQRLLESVHGEVHRVPRDNWLPPLLELLHLKGIGNLLAPQTHPLGQELRAHWPAEGPQLLAYDRPIEEWQEQLFDGVDAAITSTRGAIAETGSLIVWPSADEPRLMSLVPPLHIAVLDAEHIHATLHAALTAERWAAGLPSNALLISGPSKTADIEQTLAYGVHGPKELVVLVRV